MLDQEWYCGSRVGTNGSRVGLPVDQEGGYCGMFEPSGYCDLILLLVNCG